ncbi:hypothetical protein BDK51DRAFT_29071, partial [Blyttiomyces helicus]
AVDVVCRISGASLDGCQSPSLPPPQHQQPHRRLHWSFQTCGLAEVKLNGRRVCDDEFVAYCIRVILPTILAWRALEHEILQVQASRYPSNAPAPAPEPAPGRDLIVFLADPVQDATMRRLLELYHSRFMIQYWDPASTKLVVSVPSATEAFTSRVPVYCKALRAARIIIQLATSAGWSLASPASPLLIHSRPASSDSLLGPPTSSLSLPLAASRASENDKNSSELADPIFEPCKHGVVSEVMPLGLEDPEGLVGAIADWLESNLGQWGEADHVPGDHAGTTTIYHRGGGVRCMGDAGGQASEHTKKEVLLASKFIAYGAAIKKEGVQLKEGTAEKEGVKGKEGKQMEKKGVDGEGGRKKNALSEVCSVAGMENLLPITVEKKGKKRKVHIKWGWREFACERGRRLVRFLVPNAYCNDPTRGIPPARESHHNEIFLLMGRQRQGGRGGVRWGWCREAQRLSMERASKSPHHPLPTLILEQNALRELVNDLLDNWLRDVAFNPEPGDVLSEASILVSPREPWVTMPMNLLDEVTTVLPASCDSRPFGIGLRMELPGPQNLVHAPALQPLPVKPTLHSPAQPLMELQVFVLSPALAPHLHEGQSPISRLPERLNLEST